MKCAIGRAVGVLVSLLLLLVPILLLVQIVPLGALRLDPDQWMSWAARHSGPIPDSRVERSVLVGVGLAAYAAAFLLAGAAGLWASLAGDPRVFRAAAALSAASWLAPLAAGAAYRHDVDARSFGGMAFLPVAAGLVMLLAMRSCAGSRGETAGT